MTRAEILARLPDLRGAYLSGANLRGADLSKASLSKAYLSGAYLSGANLRGANLSGTCLDPVAPVPSITDEEILCAGFEIRGDEIWGWRTRVSQHCGTTVYTPGEHVAPVFSVDTTPCHPGIYIASLAWLRGQYCALTDADFVRCRCLRSELVHAGDKWRAKRIWVVEETAS
jgi:uncharacterized protein YjbI with pentapeptide repeats